MSNRDMRILNSARSIGDNDTGDADSSSRRIASTSFNARPSLRFRRRNDRVQCSVNTNKETTNMTVKLIGIK